MICGGKLEYDHYPNSYVRRWTVVQVDTKAVRVYKALCTWCGHERSNDGTPLTCEEPVETKGE